jgi:hypothetical protein
MEPRINLHWAVIIKMSVMVDSCISDGICDNKLV